MNTFAVTAAKTMSSRADKALTLRDPPSLIQPLLSLSRPPQTKAECALFKKSRSMPTANAEGQYADLRVRKGRIAIPLGIPAVAPRRSRRFLSDRHRPAFAVGMLRETCLKNRTRPRAATEWLGMVLPPRVQPASRMRRPAEKIAHSQMQCRTPTQGASWCAARSAERDSVWLKMTCHVQCEKSSVGSIPPQMRGSVCGAAGLIVACVTKNLKIATRVTAQ